MRLRWSWDNANEYHIIRVVSDGSWKVLNGNINSTNRIPTMFKRAKPINIQG